MAGESYTTTDHQHIKQWVEARGGKPVHVKGTGSTGDPGVLRIAFPDEDLEDISWEEFFHKFDESGLAFLCQDQLEDGRQSRFHKFVNR
jgi:hypothetical protein